MKPKILLHTCCAPCSTHSIDTLKDDYDVVMFFSNSNIFPKEEHEKRLEQARRVASIMEVEIMVDRYDHKQWLDFVSKVEDFKSLPEKGSRCHACFEHNLRKAASHALEHGFEIFTTTLTISPHKDSGKIMEIGKRIADEAAGRVRFLEKDFAKQDGFRKSTAHCNTHGIYRQDYCGCEFSMRKDKQ